MAIGGETRREGANVGRWLKRKGWQQTFTGEKVLKIVDFTTSWWLEERHEREVQRGSVQPGRQRIK